VGLLVCIASSEDVTMPMLDFSPLFRSTVGFDRVFEMLDAVSHDGTAGGYPPYNIEKRGESAYRITIAVAGFTEKDIDIVQQENTLRVVGKLAEREPSNDTTYLHRGIATRTFERRFEVADHVRVTGATLENGLLHIDLVREVPEEKKPRLIPISSSAAARPVLEKAH
jgi:molecular chaperone IbpA